MKRMDVQHHTPEQVSEYLQTAIRIAEAADISAVEQVAVLPTLLTLIASKSVQVMQDGPVTTIPAMGIPMGRVA